MYLNSWHAFGCVHGLENKISSLLLGKQRMGKRCPCHSYWGCLGHITDLQELSRNEWIIRNRYILEICVIPMIFMLLACIVGDPHSHDKICGRYFSYANVSRICLSCHTRWKWQHRSFMQFQGISRNCASVHQYKNRANPEEYDMGNNWPL